MKIIKTNPKPKPKIDWEPPIVLPDDGKTRGFLSWLRGWIDK